MKPANITIEAWNEMQADVKEIKEVVKKMAYHGQDDSISPKAACELLNISRTTYQRYVRKGIIKENQPGGKSTKIFVSRSELLRLMDEGKI